MRQEVHLPIASPLVVEVKLKTSDFQRPTWITTGSFQIQDLKEKILSLATNSKFGKKLVG
jgi:hypothetical protein